MEGQWGPRAYRAEAAGKLSATSGRRPDERGEPHQATPVEGDAGSAHQGREKELQGIVRQFGQGWRVEDNQGVVGGIQHEFPADGIRANPEIGGASREFPDLRLALRSDASNGGAALGEKPG